MDYTVVSFNLPFFRWGLRGSEEWVENKSEREELYKFRDIYFSFVFIIAAAIATEIADIT